MESTRYGLTMFLTFTRLGLSFSSGPVTARNRNVRKKEERKDGMNMKKFLKIMKSILTALLFTALVGGIIWVVYLVVVSWKVIALLLAIAFPVWGPLALICGLPPENSEWEGEDGFFTP
jgi:fatty acid desaturase